MGKYINDWKLRKKKRVMHIIMSAAGAAGVFLFAFVYGKVMFSLLMALIAFFFLFYLWGKNGNAREPGVMWLAVLAIIYSVILVFGRVLEDPAGRAYDGNNLIVFLGICLLFFAVFPCVLYLNDRVKKLNFKLVIPDCLSEKNH